MLQIGHLLCRTAVDGSRSCTRLIVVVSAFLCAGWSVVQAQQPEEIPRRPPDQPRLTFFVTDFGINQYVEDKPLRTGDGFSNAKSCVLPGLTEKAQVVLVMPPHEHIAQTSDEQLIDSIFNALRTKVSAGLSQELTTFEFQLVEHIGTVTYASPTHQDSVNRFGACAYRAIGMLSDYLRAQGYSDSSFHGILGSNGAKVFSENVDAWKGYMDDATLFDGRAFATAVIDTIDALGATNVRIFNTAGDWPAPNNVFVASIGNHDVAKGLVEVRPGLTVGWIDLLDRLDYMSHGHVAAMTATEEPRLLVKFWQGNGYTVPERLSSLQLLLDGSANSLGVANVAAVREAGVSMKVEVLPESLTSGDVGTSEVRTEILEGRPARDSLTWSPNEGESDGE